MLRPPDASETSRLILAARPGRDADAAAVADAARHDLGIDGIAAAQVADRAATPLLTRGPLAADVEQLHFELGEGPGLEARALARPVVADRVVDDPRWTAFGVGAGRADIGAVWAYPLVVAGSTGGPVGWVGFARRRPGPLSPRVLGQLELVAAVVGHLAMRAVAVGRRRDPDEGLDDLTRELVHTATGVLAQRSGIGVDGAAWQLRATAWTEGRSLTEVAAEVVGLGARSGG
jgi:GAF domain-containing protein